MREPSIFKRLFITLFGLLLVLFCLSSVLVYHSISEHLNQSKDTELVNSSHSLWDSLKNDLAKTPAPLQEEIRKEIPPNSHLHNFRVWKNNQVVFQSDNSFEDSPAAKPDFSEKKLGDAPWRTYAYYISQENIIIEVSENLLSRKMLINDIFKGFLESSILLLPLLASLLFLSLRYGLKGLSHMETQLNLRGPEMLGNLEIEQKIPKELKPLQRAINYLLEKLRDKITSEKQLIDNAAHELRTPLAAVKLHAQLANEATNEHDRAESMEDLFSTITDATELLEQLLALSRIAVEQVGKRQIKLYEVAEKVAYKYSNLRNVELKLDGDRKAEALCDEKLLEILLGVFLDNAIKFSTKNGIINLNISKNKIEIADNGPGIPMSEREKVFERFYRGKHKIQSNGLGLAIAKQICELLDIKIELADAHGGGLLVLLTFSK